MALWGKADDIYSPGTVTVDYDNKTITGIGASFLAVGVSPGVVISIGVSGELGEAVISEVISEEVISIASTQFLIPGIAGAEYTLSQKPVYLMQDSHWSGLTTTTSLSTNKVFGVDEYEAGSVSFIPHVGWVGIKTYIDADLEVRTKTEVLVAMSGISTSAEGTYTETGDAADDAILPDRFITISVQPESYEVGIGTTVTFSVTAFATPSATLSYQWQESTDGGTSYGDLLGENNDTLDVANPDAGNDGYLYRVYITADGGAEATSESGTITIV